MGIFSNIFNSETKENAERGLMFAKSEYEAMSVSINKSIRTLYDTRKSAAKIIVDIEDAMKSCRSVMTANVLQVADIRSEISAFYDCIEKENVNTDSISSKNGGYATAVGGSAVGAAIATFGAPTAMALVTTFGPAATGIAISALSGAAASNAALAFLGGGAIAAGGAEVARGAALLSAIPVIGLTIGGAAAIGGGIMTRSKNAKMAAEMDNQKTHILTATSTLRTVKSNIDRTNKDIDNAIEKLNVFIPKLNANAITSAEVQMIIGLVKVICELINKKFVA